jgi:hypothetical protein
MAAYPSFNVQRSSPGPSRSDGHDVVRATNGVLKMRRLYSATKSDFTIDHWLTSAEKTTLDSFYTTNRDLDVTYTSPEDSVAYTVRFAAPPQYVRMPGWYQARVRLVEV